MTFNTYLYTWLLDYKVRATLTHNDHRKWVSCSYGSQSDVEYWRWNGAFEAKILNKCITNLDFSCQFNRLTAASAPFSPCCSSLLTFLHFVATTKTHFRWTTQPQLWHSYPCLPTKPLKIILLHYLSTFMLVSSSEYVMTSSWRKIVNKAILKS